MPNRKITFRWIKIILIIYCLIGIAAYYLQDKVLFQSKALAQNVPFKFDIPFKEIDLVIDKDTRMNMVQFTVPDSLRKGVVLYFHGNKQNINRYAPYAANFTKHGYEVWMMDYPGYGKSTGKISEALLYEEALIVYKMARVKFAVDSIIIYGRSLGSGIASQLASVRDCRRLILETPYYNMTAVANHYLWMYPIKQMMHYKLPVNEYLQKVTAPVTIFHGTDDEVIPYSGAEQLKEVLKKGDEFITIPGGHHNDLNTYTIMQKKLDSLLTSSSYPSP